MVHRAKYERSLLPDVFTARMFLFALARHATLEANSSPEKV